MKKGLMEPLDLLGTVAGTLTTLAFVPQVKKTLRTRQTRDISLAMWVAFCTGVVLWIGYGLIIGAWPIIIANTLTLVLAGIILGIKIANRGKE
jgi:MtN3 and saliva related transmembrane protein